MRPHHFSFLAIGGGALLGFVGAGLLAACSPGSDGGSGGGASGGAEATGGTSSGGAASGGAPGGGGDAGSGGAASGGGESGGAPGSGGAATADCTQPSDAGPLTTRLPCLLSETGLFAADMTTLADGVHPYAPQFQLWSDGAEKRRFIWLPPDTQIDTSEMDFWSFPAGTKLWKEFVRDGVRVETRLIEKQSTGAWRTVAYHWREDQLEADAVPNGVDNASGTPHDVPNADDCLTCHSQQPDKVLGFTAIQLSGEPADVDDPLEWNLETLIADGLLTDPPAEPFTVPGTDAERAFFGYLHANCGHCHNPRGTANAQTGLDMWLKVADLEGAVSAFSVYQNLVDVDIVKTDGEHPAATKRIVPGDFENSAVYQRFSDKEAAWTMPPLATEVTDPDGQAVMEAFIGALTP